MSAAKAKCASCGAAGHVTCSSGTYCASCCPDKAKCHLSSHSRGTKRDTDELTKLKAENAMLRAKLAERSAPVDKPVPTAAPTRLLSTTGADWEYQKSPQIEAALRTSIPSHFANWKGGRTDKQLHPRLLVWSGPGTGKSRLLQEFPSLLQDATSDLATLTTQMTAAVAVLKSKSDAKADSKLPNVGLADSPAALATDLQSKLRGALVFNVTFENDTRKVEMTNDPAVLIANRMAWQFADQKKFDFGQFVVGRTDTPGHVLTQLSQRTGIARAQQTVVLAIDGLQMLSHKPKDKDSVLALALSVVANMINNGPEFVIACCAATVYQPVMEILHESPQIRVFLSPPSLRGHEIIQSSDPLIRSLVDDMGGHGRALEALAEQCNVADWYDAKSKSYSVSQHYDLNAFAHDLRAKLSSKYLWKGHAKAFMPLLTAALTHRRFTHGSIIPDTGDGEGKEWTVETACSFGLLRLSEAGSLEMPFILLWLLAGESRDATLIRFGFDDFNKPTGDSKRDEAPALVTWQDFDLFIAHFIALRTRAFAGQTVSVSEFHRGARFLSPDDAESTKIAVRETKRVYRATKQYDSSSSGPTLIQHESGEADIQSGGAVVVNGASAPHADVFHCVTMSVSGAQRIVRDCVQCKLVRAAVSFPEFIAETKKASSPNDIFLLATSSDSKIFTAPADSGAIAGVTKLAAIVDKSCWLDYFGPFAGRAYRHSQRPNITSNTASR